MATGLLDHQQGIIWLCIKGLFADNRNQDRGGGCWCLLLVDGNFNPTDFVEINERLTWHICKALWSQSICTGLLSAQSKTLTVTLHWKPDILRLGETWHILHQGGSLSGDGMKLDESTAPQMFSIHDQKKCIALNWWCEGLQFFCYQLIFFGNPLQCAEICSDIMHFTDIVIDIQGQAEQ